MKKLLPLLLLSFITLYSYSQEVKVQGVVKDASNSEPLPGVNVLIKGTTRGVITDLDGNYTIMVNKNDTLQFSYVGYLHETVLVGNQKTLNMDLIPDIEAIEEIVVIGYGTVRKADATGAVSVVGSEEFNRGTTNSVQELLVGRTAGVVISTNSGAPGNESTIRIRGGTSIFASNDPLIVIDGVPIDYERIGGSPNTLANLNPNDIENITILKDASATAIYGARAANGVMIILTKRGTKDFQVNYSATFSLSTIPEKIDVFSGNEFRALIYDRYPEGHDARSLLGDANTDWQNEIYQNAFGQDHNLNFSGTADNTPYRISFGYNNSDGILKTYNYERLTWSVGIDPSLFNDHLKIKYNLKISLNNNNFAEQGAIGNAVYFDPTKPVRNGNTRWRGYYVWTSPGTGIDGPYNAFSTPNPVAQLELTDNTSEVISGIGNVQFDYAFHFLPELHANLNLGYELSESLGHNNAKDSTTWANDPVATGGRYNPYHNIRNSKLLDFYLNYKTEIEPLQSSVEVMAGYSWSYFYRENRDIVMNEARTDTARSNILPTEYYLLSYFGRFIYSFKNRYILTFTLRDDATSLFAPETRWGLFPSAAFAWKVNEESFLKNSEIISELKIRLGYGVTGQQYVTDNHYPYFATYTYGDDEAQYQLGNTFYHTYRPDPYDYGIKWEETVTYNIGVDFGLYKNRFTGSLDLYKKLTSDLINEIEVAAGTNFGPEVITNVGSMENKGVEFSINAGIISRSNLSWEFGCNISYNQNKITKLNLVDDPDYFVPAGDAVGGTQGYRIQAQIVGHPINSFYLYEQVYDSDGNPIEDVYVDQNDDGIINSSDLIIYKKPAADVLMGMVSRLYYKNWDFSFAGRLSLGNYVFNEVKSTSRYNRIYDQSHHTLSNCPTYLNETQFETGQYEPLSDHFLENASFFRMDNISLGYRFKNIINNRLNIHVSATVLNAFIITKYTGLDPEVNDGIDNNIFPRTRTFMLGLNCEF
ncbi:MAG: SusC/RagA family TonB-linked outer membrane protein [Bacteroidales bacterium]|nr:SusC/RagA family TonB-linked outer membrane protein [Bacteroidales bacterium]